MTPDVQNPNPVEAVTHGDRAVGDYTEGLAPRVETAPQPQATHDN